MSKQNGYRDLIVWQKAIQLVLLTYKVTRDFPATERYGLTSQMRRAAVSVAANIAEGHGRTTGGEYTNHLSIARGSLKELETLYEIGVRLELLTPEPCGEALRLADEISRMLTGLKRSITR